MRTILFGFAFWTFVPFLPAQTTAPPEPKLIPRIYYVPPSMFSLHPSDSDAWKSFKPTPGVIPVEEQATYLDKTVYDVRKWFEAQGISFPEGSEAIYVQDGSVIFVRNTRENIDLIDTLLPGREDFVTNLRNEISIVTFKTKGERLSKPTPTFVGLKKLA